MSLYIGDSVCPDIFGNCLGLWAIAQIFWQLPSIAQILGNSNGCCPALSETKQPDFEVWHPKPGVDVDTRHAQTCTSWT